jgi:hypothetical protein
MNGRRKAPELPLRHVMFPLQFQPPPLQAIIEVELRNESTRVLKDRHDDTLLPNPESAGMSISRNWNWCATERILRWEKYFGKSATNDTINCNQYLK